MKITVFTPTYNRAHTLSKLYDSLLKQDFSDFEWLVIDDGSADGTETLVNSFMEKSAISIRYIKVPNGGKHRAINRATDLAHGEIFFIVDSDDYLTPNALSRLVYWFETLNDAGGKFAGVAGQRGYSETQQIGATFCGEYNDTLYFDRNSHST